MIDSYFSQTQTLYQIEHFFSGLFFWPFLQLKALANSS
jgi:hypothetical protein